MRRHRIKSVKYWQKSSNVILKEQWPKTPYDKGRKKKMVVTVMMKKAGRKTSERGRRIKAMMI